MWRIILWSHLIDNSREASRIARWHDALGDDGAMDQLLSDCIEYSARDGYAERRDFETRKEAIDALRHCDATMIGEGRRMRDNAEVWELCELDDDGEPRCDADSDWTFGGTFPRSFNTSRPDDGRVLTQREVIVHDGYSFGEFDKDSLHEGDVIHLIELHIEDDARGVPQVERRTVGTISVTEDYDEDAIRRAEAFLFYREVE